jgi:hypothetical protein
MKPFILVLVFAAFSLFMVNIGAQLLDSASSGFISRAEAIVGRPLTPISYAGVARRTVRRCAVGVYDCY